jgi:hypothetical protein
MAMRRAARCDPTSRERADASRVPLAKSHRFLMPSRQGGPPRIRPPTFAFNPPYVTSPTFRRTSNSGLNTVLFAFQIPINHYLRFSRPWCRVRRGTSRSCKVRERDEEIARNKTESGRMALAWSSSRRPDEPRKGRNGAWGGPGGRAERQMICTNAPRTPPGIVDVSRNLARAPTGSLRDAAGSATPPLDRTRPTCGSIQHVLMIS